MIRAWILLTAAVGLFSGVAVATADDEYRVEIVDEPAPADEISAEIAATLSPKGLRIVRGESRTICTIWPSKVWKVQPDFAPSIAILYPFTPGSLLGVAKYPRRAEDFRVQEIPSGTYTLRYALQPEDGSHVGTSDTRDFLLLLPADQDDAPAALDEGPLFELSAQTAGGTHPTMLSLLRAAGGDHPAMHHDEARDWWSVRFANPTAANGAVGELVLQLVVVGHAAE